MDKQWTVEPNDRARVTYLGRMENYTADQKEFFKRWSARCYDYNGDILFYNEAKEYGMNASWSATVLQGLWEDFMAWPPTNEQLATLVLHERPGLRCGALAWLATRASCPDKEYPNYWGDHRDCKCPSYLVEAAA